MKRIVVFLLSVSLILGLCACGAQPEEPTQPATEAPTEAPVETPTETIPEGLIDEEEARALSNYYVVAVDENGDPVAGATVQLNSDNAVPCITDETGTAVFSLIEGNYTASIEEFPMGYDFANDYREFAFEPGAYYLTITVRLSIPEPEDLGMEEGEAPVEELPEEIAIPEG